jgi:hypothetical protein
MLGKLFSRATQAAPSLFALKTQPFTEWQQDGAYQVPMPDWDTCEPKESLSDAQQSAHWSSVAVGWLTKLSQAFDKPLVLWESDDFFLLSALSARESEVLLEYAQKAMKRNLATLARIASSEGRGKMVILVLDSEDDYYRYISNFYPEDGEYALSGGMFLQHGYGHFVFWRSEMHAMEPVLVHELAHALVQHLPLPAWLNEGLAVNTERRWAPRPDRYKPNEYAYLHANFWNPQTMQEFWSGKSFIRPDDGQALSYDLAARMVEALGHDYGALAAFANAATSDDAGLSASQTQGWSLVELTQAAIGAAFELPDPAQWQSVEKGWF